MKIITVSREFGSGGREIGKRLADELGVSYYDREIISAIAEKSSLDEEYVENIIEGGIKRTYPITYSHTFSYMPALMGAAPGLISQQHAVIKELAAKGDCVIVGRGADIILEKENPFKLFVYADMKSKIARCRSRETGDEILSDKELERRIKRIDKARKESHDILSPYSWGERQGYNLCVNTSGTEIKAIVPSIADYIKIWFESNR